MINRIPTDWQPDCRVYKKADLAGMDVKWVKEQLLRFIEITEDRGQSLNRHFDNYLRLNHKSKQNKRPQPADWESRVMHKTDPPIAQGYLLKIRELL